MSRSEKTAFPHRLYQAMRFQHITVSELARLLGVSRVTIHAWLAASSAPTVPRLTLLADVLGVTTAYLLGHEEPVKIPPNFTKYRHRFLATGGVDREETQRRFEDFDEYLRFLRNRTRRVRAN